ncbi:hypothetical protein COLO4_33776 [Corchorus olitorius]|uniref:Uncharacterized protein n=1 Tax=Corchorus olitorius TaxID=93759 RepID=A0A1R3GRG5_9ROSI|nr:hypothetical protein COLO4_33776 [Corchorus olitorius]
MGMVSCPAACSLLESSGLLLCLHPQSFCKEIRVEMGKHDNNISRLLSQLSWTRTNWSKYKVLRTPEVSIATR